MVGKILEIGFTGDFGYMRFHDLRHTCATRAIERSTSPKVLPLLWGHTSIQAAMERYVHMTSKSLVDAVQPFAQSPRNVNIPTPFWRKDGVQNRACCPIPTASSFLIPVCADEAGKRRECRPSPPSDTPYSPNHSAQLWCRCQTFGECQQLFLL